MSLFAALLADRMRPVILPGLGLVLLGLWLGYGRVVDARALHWDDVVEPAGASFVGRDVVVSFGWVKEVEADRFVLLDEGHEVEVVGSLPGLARGRVASVVGPLTADGVIELREGRVHRLRRLKWLSGIVTLCVVGTLVGIDLVRLWRDPDA